MFSETEKQEVSGAGLEAGSVTYLLCDLEQVAGCLVSATYMFVK